MSQLKEYLIPYKGLEEGEYEYKYLVGESFFEVFSNDDIQGAKLAVLAILNKKSTHIEVNFSINGTLTLECGRCLDVYENDISIKQSIYIKFGDEYIEEDENLYILPETDNDIDLSKFINELIVVALPMRRVHPDDEDGNPTCSSSILNYIENINNEGSKITDPRWNELNKLRDGTS